MYQCGDVGVTRDSRNALDYMQTIISYIVLFLTTSPIGLMLKCLNVDSSFAIATTNTTTTVYFYRDCLTTGQLEVRPSI